ncbi:hypothetical protein [Paraburkholderia sp. MM5482-R1]|uniref:hypothetical protein n=1 Tax=unclassified Paraburkholderia TaxID=2615204 RepID=UPI003D1FC102
MLTQYIRDTYLRDIPRNQWGMANRAKICSALHIPRSTIGSNNELYSVFDTLDRALRRLPNPRGDNIASAPSATPPKDETAMQTVLVNLQRTNEHLIRELARYEHLQTTGIRFVAIDNANRDCGSHNI